MKCIVCQRTPKEISEYKHNDEGMHADQFIMMNEKTYDPVTRYFCCTICYNKIGKPLRRILFRWYKDGRVNGLDKYVLKNIDDI